MIGTLAGFVDELRAVGIPVSMVEALDAGHALGVVDIADRRAVQEALAATMVKNHRHRAAFDVAFDVYFGLTPAAGEPGTNAAATAQMLPTGAGGVGSGEGGESESHGDPSAEELADALVAALAGGDRAAMLDVVRRAVERLAGMEPGRPVGGRYYLYRVLRQLDVDRVRSRLLDEAGSGDGLDGRLRRRRVEASMDEFTKELRREIVRRLVADRGAAAVAKTLRRPLVEDLDLMHATREELAEIERMVRPLARKLAARLAQLRRHGRRGRLDVRRTIRRSLSHGGVLLDPKFKPPRRSKPELFMLCDVSGSMATFAKFTLQLVYAIAHQFSRVRSFAFIDALDEVTDYFTPEADFADALAALSREARIVWQDGHSDYGHSLAQFWEQYGADVTPRSTVIITGDARNNYRESGEWVLEQLASAARTVLWLNPEPRRYWNTGDSIMSAYRPHCDAVFEVRTLRQLERFVEAVALRASLAPAPV